MSLNEFINKRRKELNMSIDDLVAESGIPKGTLSKITAGINTNPTLSTVETLCKALKCSINDAVGYDSETDSFSSSELKMIKKYRALDEHGKKIVDFILDEEYKHSSEEQNEVYQTNCLVLTMYEDAVSAGTGEYLNDGRCVEVTVDETPLTERADFILRISGDSMEPTYHDGDKVLVESTTELNVGEIGIFILNGQGYIKEYSPEGLVSHNKKYGIIRIGENDRCEVIGKVIGKI